MLPQSLSEAVTVGPGLALIIRHSGTASTRSSTLLGPASPSQVPSQSWLLVDLESVSEAADFQVPPTVRVSDRSAWLEGSSAATGSLPVPDRDGHHLAGCGPVAQGSDGAE